MCMHVKNTDKANDDIVYCVHSSFGLLKFHLFMIEMCLHKFGCMKVCFFTSKCFICMFTHTDDGKR